MFPIVNHKDLHEFEVHCQELGVKTVYISINHETRKQQLPTEIVIARFLSLHMTAYAKDPDTGMPILIRFWTVELISTQGNGAPNVRASEAEIRARFLGAIKLVELNLGVKVMRGYATWLGDPALVPGDIAVSDEYLKELADKALEAQPEAPESD